MSEELQLLELEPVDGQLVELAAEVGESATPTVSAAIAVHAQSSS
jgi:hypothetical protein